jgi:hypothetical protein
MADFTAYQFLLDCADLCTEAKVQAEACGDFVFANEAASLEWRCLHRARDGFEQWGTEGARQRGIATLLADLIRFQGEVPARDCMTDDGGLVVLESWHVVSRSIVETVVAGFLNAEALGE